MEEAGAAVVAIGPALGSWRIVTLQLVRSRMLTPRPGSADAWAGVVEYRARLLAQPY
jgi:hypothetical protein